MNADDLPLIDPGMLCPYASFLILQCSEDIVEEAFKSLRTMMLRASLRTRSANHATLIASGLQNVEQYLRNVAIGIDAVDAFVYQREMVSSWAKDEADYTDIENLLAVMVRRGSLIAVHCTPALQSSIQKWLDKPPRPSIARVSSDIIQGAFLRGEAKGLWLRGAHSPRRTKANSKNISGPKLEDALNPFEDSTFALGSARAAIAPSGDPSALTGNVGTTPRKALLWLRPTATFSEFLTLAIEVFDQVEATVASNGAVKRPYPILAEEANDLSKVYGAYDIGLLQAEESSMVPGADEELIAASNILGRAVFNIRGFNDSPDFILETGLDGKFSGSLRCAVQGGSGAIHFTFGFEGEPKNLDAVRAVFDALEVSKNDLLVVYYDSGHMVDGRSIWTQEVRATPFPNWSFEDFAGFDITKEKPLTSASSQAIHDAIGVGGDVSLFAWVVKHYNSGWLICDDGSGEVADFLHLAQNGTLTFIHVKAAESGSNARTVAVGAYEVVASQAAKNLINFNIDLLRKRLSSPPATNPASWTDGTRASTRAEFIDALQYRTSRDALQVVIIQPHVSRPLYQRVQADSVADEINYRMRLLETLLNSSRASVVSLGADLHVIGDAN